MFTRIMNLKPIYHFGLTAVAFGAFQAVKSLLDESYAASKYPVDYATGQLAFSAEKLEGYYAVMSEAGTLGTYWKTQFIDFGFIASVIALSLFLGTLVARIGKAGSWGRRVGGLAALSGIAGASFDALENLVSFVMLAKPDAISQAVAMAYSSAAAAKFGLLTLAMALVIVTVVLGGISRLRG
jgi:hypothetical protein